MSEQDKRTNVWKGDRRQLLRNGTVFTLGMPFLGDMLTGCGDNGVTIDSNGSVSLPPGEIAKGGYDQRLATTRGSIVNSEQVEKLTYRVYGGSTSQDQSSATNTTLEHLVWFVLGDGKGEVHAFTTDPKLQQQLGGGLQGLHSFNGKIVELVEVDRDGQPPQIYNDPQNLPLILRIDAVK